MKSYIHTNYWGRSGLVLMNDGHTLRVKAPVKTDHHTGVATIDSWGEADYSTLSYDSEVFYFHQPSEHTFNGMRYDMELQLEHRQTTGDKSKLIYMSFFFSIGEKSEFLESIHYSEVGKKENDKVHIIGEISPMDFISEVNEAEFGFIEYEGSQTVPPCTEGVTWILWRKATTMSKEQWESFATKLEEGQLINYHKGTGNYRPTQNLNGRTVTLRNWYIKNGKQRFSQGEVLGITLGTLCILIILAGVLGWVSYKCYQPQKHEKMASQDEELKDTKIPQDNQVSQEHGGEQLKDNGE